VFLYWLIPIANENKREKELLAGAAAAAASNLV
jgi:hypothetical protein